MTVQEVKCQQCNKKCPQEQLASDIAKGRMYVTNELLQCQKELEQYKALGPVEELKNQKHNLSVAYKIIDDYSKIGTVEELKEAKEKQIPKKPTEINEIAYGKFYRIDFMCPSCDTSNIENPYKPNFCKHCGQKLDWKEGGTSD